LTYFMYSFEIMQFFICHQYLHFLQVSKFGDCFFPLLIVLPTIMMMNHSLLIVEKLLLEFL
jgi:hypothetical protein